MVDVAHLKRCMCNQRRAGVLYVVKDEHSSAPPATCETSCKLLVLCRVRPPFRYTFECSVVSVLDRGISGATCCDSRPCLVWSWR